MVLTRLSHVGETCPLRDHSYSDPVFSNIHQASSSRRIVSVPKGSPDASISNVECGESLALQPINTIHILDFPNEILEKILSFLPYKAIGEVRRVCKRFDKISCHLLNSAFQKLQNLMLSQFQATKSQMPRRESARRKHPLARESDILETLHMRLTLLQMTFGKHIERKHCCFFAGDILDEVYRILRNVRSTQNIGKTFKITDELFDLSTMAMEYFKEHIEPALPEISYFGSDFLDITSRFSDGRRNRSCSGGGRVSDPEDDLPDRDPLPPSNMVLRKRIRKIRQGMRRYNRQLAVMRREVRACRNRIGEQNKQIMEYIGRLEECDKKIDDTTGKLSTVLQELNKCKTELHYWRSKSPVHTVCMLCHCRRFSAGEFSGGASEASWVAREAESPGGMATQARLGLPDYAELPPNSVSPNSLSPSAGVKNLEPLFDIETKAAVSICGTSKEPSLHPITLSTSALSIIASGSTPFPSASSEGGFKEGTRKRLYSDDDTDTDVDTVGKRVKERKRIRFEPH